MNDFARDRRRTSRRPSPHLGIGVPPHLCSTVLKRIEPHRFANDREYFRFALGLVRSLGHHNTVETHGLMYEPVLVRAAQQDQTDRARRAPPALRDLDLEALGLTLVDGPLVLEQMPMSFFDEAPLREAFDRKVLVDPLYGVALVREAGRWIDFTFAVETLARQLRADPASARRLTMAPGSVLDTGLTTCRKVLSESLPADAVRSLAAHCVPEIVIETPADLLRWKAEFAELQVRHPNVKVWLRGQVKEFLTPDRSVAVGRGCLGHSRVRDALLIPSVYRETKKHYADRRALHAFLTSLFAWHDAARDLVGPDYEIVPLGGDPTAAPLGDVAEFSTHTQFLDNEGQVLGGFTKHYHRQNDVLKMGLLLQHYGCPTPFLDVTSDLDVAHWFASHGYVGRPDQLFEDGGSDSACIYVFLAVEDRDPFIDLVKMDPVGRSLRARRQKCGLVAGPGLLLRNYAARFVAL